MWFGCLIIILIVAKWLTQLFLERLNRRNVLKHAATVPESFRGVIDEPTYRKSVEYTLAKGKLDRVGITWATVVLLALLFSGVLPWASALWGHGFGATVWANGGFLVFIGIILSLTGLPLDWYHQFRLEERFGFNTT